MEQDPSSQVTMLLKAAESGDQKAAGELLPAVYGELRRMANFLMQREKAGHSLEATALVHEAYLRLIGEGAEGQRGFEGRKHFFNAAALAMRRVLLDRARRKGRARHGGEASREDLDVVQIPAAAEFGLDRMEELDGALNELASHNARWAEIVQLRYFLGLSIEQTAEMLGVSPATVKSDWNFARGWLKHTLLKKGA